MASKKDTYLDWLSDAHAMEETLVKVLEKQAEEAPEDMPEMKDKITEHCEKTKEHAEKVAACIERNGGSTSTMKDWTGKISAAMQGLGMGMMEDELVKNAHSSYVAENFEIATYTIIRTAAEELGDTEGVSMCDEILRDEEDMAVWISKHLPEVASRHFSTLEEEE